MSYFFSMNRWFCLLLLLFLSPAYGDSSTMSVDHSDITVLTSEWSPYINKEGASTGSAALALNILSSEIGTNIKWKYLPYSSSYDLVVRKKYPASFPWFKTQKRSEEVLYSKPLFEATSRLYFNRHFFAESEVEESWSTLRIGKVQGYSYGSTLDTKIAKAIPYSSEYIALQALLDNEIDILPMTEKVMVNMLKNNFPNQKELIRMVPGVSDSSSLYLIAAKTEQGEEIINYFNKALDVMNGSLFTSKPPEKKNKKKSADLAQLVSAEGYPVILGQTDKISTGTNYYILPQGSRVLVLEWSPKILESSKTDRLYKSMIDVSRVVILNGPHVGKELYVRNMHISLL